MKQSEKSLQQSIVECLDIHGWTVNEYAKPGARGPLKTIRDILERCGVPDKIIRYILSLIAQLGGKVPEGHTDLLALKRLPGRNVSWFIEVKVPGQKQPPAQQEFADRMIHAGAFAHSVTCLEDVLVVLRYLGDEVKVEVR
jgi:hypothetical protein